RGAILLIASTRAGMSEPHTEAYSASKAGLVGLTHALAMSLAPVRVNCISPGWIVTDDWQHDGRKTSLTEQDQAQHPVGRVGRPEDVDTNTTAGPFVRSIAGAGQSQGNLAGGIGATGLGVSDRHESRGL
ncbi:MAG: SDR family oxidoreductase, partial [Kiritimatiellia bacterium]